MNYKRIYEELIADRLIHQPHEDSYAEIHHILPRCLGGSNEPSNLIRLTPEDHFFAHLLLAKHHNTHETWAGVMIMHERKARKTITYSRSRKEYGWARRRYGELCQEKYLGESNPNYKPETIDLKNHDGIVHSRTRLEWSDIGIPHAALCLVMTGKRKSYHGWRLPITDAIGNIKGSDPKIDRTIRSWVHLDGRKESCTAYDLASRHNLRRTDITEVAAGRNKQAFGWHIEGAVAGWPCGRKGHKSRSVFTIVDTNGKVITGTPHDIYSSGEIDQRSLWAITSGTRQSAKGWKVAA